MSNFNVSNLVPVSYDKVAKGTKAIKVGNQIFTFQNSMEFYKCASVVQDVVYYTVANASEYPECNGDYYQFSGTGNENVYKHESSEIYLFKHLYGDTAEIGSKPEASLDRNIYYQRYEWAEEGIPTAGWEDINMMDFGVSVTKQKEEAPKTWDGYKVDMATGTLSQELTTELTYSTRKPVAGGVYSADARIKPDYFKIQRSGEMLIVPLVSNEANALTGQELIETGDIVLDCGCFYFGNANSYISADINAHDVLTATMWVNPNSYEVNLFSLWTGGNENLGFCQGSEGNIRVYADSSYDKMTSITGKSPVASNFWRHYAIIVYNNKFKAFLNGEYLGEAELPDGTIERSYTSCRIHGVGFSLSNSFHRVRDFRIYGRELTEAEITAIVAENNPQSSD